MLNNLLNKWNQFYYILIIVFFFFQSEECNIVTLGVGGDVAAEEKMKTKFPSTCQFHGADPGETNAIDYAPIGKFHKVTVGSYSQTWDGVVVARNFFILLLIDLFIIYQLKTILWTIRRIAFKSWHIP